MGKLHKASYRVNKASYPEIGREFVYVACNCHLGYDHEASMQSGNLAPEIVLKKRSRNKGVPNPQHPTQSDIEEQQKLALAWAFYTDFWKIVGRHSELWNYPKMETILKLQEWIDAHTQQAVQAARVDELEKLRTDSHIDLSWYLRHNGSPDMNPQENGEEDVAQLVIDYLESRITQLQKNNGEGQDG